MYKVSIQHLEEIKKTLESANYLFKWRRTDTVKAAEQVKKNEKAIKLINQYIGK